MKNDMKKVVTNVTIILTIAIIVDIIFTCLYTFFAKCFEYDTSIQVFAIRLSIVFISILALVCFIVYFDRIKAFYAKYPIINCLISILVLIIVVSTIHIDFGESLRYLCDHSGNLFENIVLNAAMIISNYIIEIVSFGTSELLILMKLY